MKSENIVIRRMLFDYLKGLGLVLGVSLGLGILGALLFGFLGADQDLKEVFRIAMMLSLLALLTIGGQFAFEMLFEVAIEKPKKLTFMHALGGVSAWILAFYIGPLVLDCLDQADTDEVCEIVYERKLGPLTFSKTKCPK